LYALFFQPAVVFVLRNEPWGRAFRLFALVSLLCGAAMSGVRVPRIMAAARDWAGWFGKRVAPVWVEKGELHWDRPKQLPATLRRQGWRFDFSPKKTPLPPPEQLGPETQGLWVTPDAVRFWWRAEGGRLGQTVLFQDGKLLGKVPLSDIAGDGRVTLTPDRIESEAVTRIRPWLVVYVLFGAVRVLFEGLFYTFVFALIPALMRSPLVTGGFRRLLTLYTFAAVPPMIVATVYATLDLPYLEHALIFVIGLVVYLSIATRAAARAAASGAD